MQDIWKRFFDQKHDEVARETAKLLTDCKAGELLHLSGLSLMMMGRAADALPRLRAAVALSPVTHWFTNASISALNAGAPEAALEFARDGLRHHPKDKVLHFTAANALMHTGRLEDALAEFEQALTIDPAMNDARVNKGNCLRRMNRPTEALPCYNAVLSRDPKNGNAMINRIGTLIEMNRLDEAESVLVPLHAETKIPELAFMLAVCRLTSGDYASGWSLYRDRWKCGMAKADAALFKKPLLPDLAAAAGKHVLISHEQGFGDSLQFCRFIPFIRVHAAKVTVLVPPSLVRTMQTVDPHVRVVSGRIDAGNYDYELPMLDMPAVLGTTLDTIPNQIPYIHVPESVLASRRLPPAAIPAKRRIGLCWAGQLRTNCDLAAVDRRRSVTFDTLLPGLKGIDAQFVSLQLGDPAKQMDIDHGLDLVAPLDNRFDFLDSAAIIQQLDLVITVDTAVAHLAAAVGTPTWVLSRYDGCWRWLKGRDDSPWYPGVMRLFRQSSPSDWGSVVTHIHTALKEFAS